MAATPPESPAATRPQWRSVALPTEHGGWGFTLEPILLGALLVPGVATVALAATALGLFLARRPVRLVATDLVRRRWLPRSRLALRFAGLYGAAALAGLAVAVTTADGPFWSPLLGAGPLAAVAVSADSRSQSRSLWAEVAGATAIGATVTAMALAAGWEGLPAYGLWLVLTARTVASIALVRGQIRRVHGRPARAGMIYATQLAAVAALLGGALVDVVPWLAVAALVGVAVVAYVSLTRPPVAARVVGWVQMAVGLFVVVLTAIGSETGM